MDRNMVLFFVLENVELLEPVLLALSRAGIRGATILDSTGAAKTVFAHTETDPSSALRRFFNPAKSENKTIFTVLPEKMISAAKEAIESVVGDLSKPFTGIMFAVEAMYVSGIPDMDDRSD